MSSYQTSNSPRRRVGLLTTIIISSLSVMFTAWLLPGVEVADFMTAVWVALALGVLNWLVKPFLVILTLPITVLTLGLFLIVINAVVIMMAASWVSGFAVNGFLWAILFSFIQSTVMTFLIKLGE